VSQLLDDAGNVTASYGYSAYGGGDAPSSDTESLTRGDPDPQAPLNPYRYSSRRMDSGTVASTSPAVASGAGGYDMDARRCGPDIGAFLQQDQFNGALADLGLATDPLTQNRYALAGGNPVSYVEWDGHIPTADNPVSANPTLNVQLNSTTSTWSGKDRFVGCACSGLDQQVQAASRSGGSGGSGGGFNPFRSWMNLYQGYVNQAQQEGEGLAHLGKLLGCGFAHRYAGLCSEQTYQEADRVFNNPDRLSIGQQAAQLWEGATAPVRQAWTSGHKAEAAGRALWIGLSAVTAAKGLSAARRAGAEGEAAALNSAGRAYPRVLHPGTGEPIPHPGEGLMRVPVAQRVPWGAQERGAFIKEWYDRGFSTPKGGWSNYDIHHITPREYGGTNDFENLVPVERGVHQNEFNAWWRDY